MNNIQPWHEGKDEYILNDGFILKRADKLEFGIHETIYSNMDLELRFSWRKQTAINYDNHFWIFKEHKRIGGVHIGSNYIASIFTEPPYEVGRFAIISALNDALLQWTSKDNKIMAYGVTPKDIEHFHKLGYRIECERRVMIRPTEVFKDISLSDDFVIKLPDVSDAPIIGKLLFESYSGGIDYEIFGQRSLDEAVMDAERILNIYKSNGTLDGSTLIFDKKSNELVAACLAGVSGYCDNDFSEIGEVVVKPHYRKLGLATIMIKLALTNLNKISPATILCVTIGNKSEGLYHNLGFFSGVKFTNMYLNN